MPKSLRVYVQTQGIIAAVINATLNPLLAWLGNRRMEFVSLTGGHSLLADTAVTCVVLSLLVALFAASGFHRDLAAGRVTAADKCSRKGRLLSRLPSQAWALGLVLGFGSAAVLVPLTLGLFRCIGISGLPFVYFALLKAAYTGLLGFVVTRWAILRQWLPVPHA